MQDKKQILSMLRDEFNRWEELLARKSIAQISARQAPGSLSLQDVMAHLMTWQQRSIARLEAGLHNREPVFPRWLDGIDPREEEPVDEINAWIFATHRDRPWSDVYRDWREGFLRFLEIGAAIPEDDLLEVGKYPWLPGYPLAIVLTSSYEHHAEHREQLQD